MNTKGQKNILLVEDEALIGMAESMDLKSYGYDVIHVLNGQQAIDTVNDVRNEIDIILMDINLGQGIDGTEIAKIILEEHDIPLLFLSSHIERDIVDKTENITSYGYVVKNSSITVLDASIKMAFRLHEANQNLKKQKLQIENKKKDLLVYEKRYRRLFESAKDGILILSAINGMIVDVNPYLVEILGYSKEQFLNKSIWDISAFKNIDYSKQLYKELQDKEFVRYHDLPLETFDGNQIHVEFVSNAYYVDSEKVIQCNIRDITDRKIYENKLQTSIIEKDALLKEIQHRIKNSFNMITSLIILRSKVTHSEETKNILEELISRVKSVSDLYSILSETNSFYEVEIRSYCNKIIDSMIIFSKNVEIKKSIEEITISTKNATSIGIILVELLTNAIKYAFPDSKKGIINIELKTLNSKLLLIVEDNGIGLQKDFDINKINSVGFQIVNLIVSQMDGNIQFVVKNGTKIVIECIV